MSTSIAIRFVLTPSEYAGAVRQRMLRRASAVILLGFGALWIVAPLFSYCAVQAQDPEARIPLSSFWPSIVGLLVLVLLYGISPMLVYRKLNPANRDREQEFRFSEEGIDARTATAEGKMEWSTWLKFMETGRFFLVFPTQQVFHIIPKRAFSSPEEVDAFRELLKRKLGTA